MKQRALFFPSSPTFTRKNYVVGACNGDAFRVLEAWPAWGAFGTLIVGEAHSGKTHLCHTFLESHTEALYLNGHTCAAQHPFDLNESIFILDDVEHASETWLFHFFNHAKDNGSYFILTMSQHYQNWCKLPDLCSRLATLPLLTLNLPDDALMLAHLKKNLTDRGVSVDSSVLSYLVQHIDRSYASVEHWVNVLERLSAEQKRNITIAFVRGILNDQSSLELSS
ncbi:MAG: hypothetical protein V4482_02115 [Pseudomonadota bacterium]